MFFCLGYDNAKYCLISLTFSFSAIFLLFKTPKIQFLMHTESHCSTFNCCILTHRTTSGLLSFAIDEEDEEGEECETNQHFAGMQELFRGCVVVVWEGTELNSVKYRKLNKIAVRKYVEIHMKCWKDRNEVHYNEQQQRKRVIDWY